VKHPHERNPPNPPLRKGGSKWDYFTCNKSSSPFAKGGSRGILLRLSLPENHRSVLTLNYTTSTAPYYCIGFWIISNQDVSCIAVARPQRWACHLATAGCWIRGILEQYVAGSDARGRQEGRPDPWSQQVIHEISWLFVIPEKQTLPMHLSQSKHHDQGF